jgi:hypothetical protein
LSSACTLDTAALTKDAGIVAGQPSRSTGFSRIVLRTLTPGARVASAAASAIERNAVAPVARATAPRALALLDRLLDAPITTEAADHIASSAVLQVAVERALAGPVGDAVAESIAEHEVIERIAKRLAESGELDRLVRGALTSDATDAIADEAVARLLESEQLWVLVDEIARSPSVTAAISRQGLGLADQFAAIIRERSSRADSRVEHAAKRLARRDRSPQEPEPRLST